MDCDIVIQYWQPRWLITLPLPLKPESVDLCLDNIGSGGFERNFFTK